MRLLVGVLLAILLSGTATAQSSWIGTFEASDGSFAGTGSVAGRLAVLADLTPMTNPSEGLEFSAEALFVERTYTQAYATAAGISVHDPPQTTQAEHAKASIRSVGVRPGAELYVIGDDAQVDLDWDCGRFRFSPVEWLEVPRRLEATRSSDAVSVSTKTEWMACGPTQVAIHGDFRIVVWEWDLEVETASGSTTYRSGDEARDQAAATDTGAAQLFLRVTDGNLTVRSQVELPALRVFLADEVASVEGSLVFHDVTGRFNIDSPRELSSESLELVGSLRLGVLREGAPAFDLHGALTDAQSDGRPVRISAPDAASSRWWLLPLIGVALLAPLGAGAGVTLRRRWLENRIDLVEGLIQEGSYSRAATASTALVRSRTFHVDGVVLRMDALLRDGRPQEALSFLDGAGEIGAGARPIIDFGRARAHAALGQHAEARAHVEACLRAAPEMLPQIQDDAALQRYLGSKRRYEFQGDIA